MRGISVDTVDGGVVLEVTDEERAAAAFGKLVGILRSRGGVDARPTRVAGADVAFQARRPGAPKPIVMARGSERVVIAYGAAAASEAFALVGTLADGDVYGEAGELLGDGFEPSFLLAMPAVVALAQSASAGDPDWEEARPYLEAFSVLAAGARVEDDRARGRFVAGLK